MITMAGVTVFVFLSFSGGQKAGSPYCLFSDQTWDGPVYLTPWGPFSLGLGPCVMTNSASFHSLKHTSLNMSHSPSKLRQNSRTTLSITGALRGFILHGRNCWYSLCLCGLNLSQQ